LEREEKGDGWSGGWGGRSAWCCRGGGTARGGWERRKEDAKETIQIIQKNKSIMLDEKGCKDVN
jgi:hypothetical protein